MGNVPVVEWFSVNRMMKTGFGFVALDRCDEWLCFAYHKLPTEDNVPDEFYCIKSIHDQM